MYIHNFNKYINETLNFDHQVSEISVSVLPISMDNKILIAYKSTKQDELSAWDLFTFPIEFSEINNVKNIISKATDLFCNETGFDESTIVKVNVLPTMVEGFCLDCGDSNISHMFTKLDKNINLFYCNNCRSTNIEIEKINYNIQYLLSKEFESTKFLEFNNYEKAIWIKQNELEYYTPKTDVVDFIFVDNKNLIKQNFNNNSKDNK